MPSRGTLTALSGLENLHGSPWELHEVQQGQLCKVLHMGWGNSQHKYRLGGKWVESSPAKKDSGRLVGEKLNMTWQCSLAAQKSNPGLHQKKYAQWVKERDSAPLPWRDPTWSPASSSGALSTGKIWTCWSRSRGGSQK